MTDPFHFYKDLHLSDNPAYRAPEDAINSWKSLATEAQAELARMGFPASIVPNGNPFQLPAGAHIWVHEIQPFGVELDWVPPVTKTAEFTAKVVAQDVSGLFGYVSNAKQIIIRAIQDVLKEAGFRTLVDHQAGNSHIYRVLSAPQHPLR
jgi:hypothetical protein